MNTTDFLMIASAIVPDRVAMHFDGEEITFADVQERVNRLANGMADRGVGAGDRVAVMQVNCPEVIEAYFAIAQLDAIYVPINFRAKSEELEQMLKVAQPSLLLIGERYLPLLDNGGSGISTEQVVVLDGEAPPSAMTYQDLIADAIPDQLHFAEAGDDDTTVIMFTAGTTGVPKGVMLTHDGFSSYLLATVNPADPDIEETNLLTVPLYHIAGLQAALAAVYGGRTLVVMRQFEPLEWMTLVQRYRVSRAMLVPTMLKHVMDHPRFEEFDLSSLEVMTYGAAPMPMEVIREAIRRFPGARFINAFGQTETASTITMLPPEDHVLEGSPEEIETKLRRLTSIGKPLEDVEVRIVDEDGNPVKAGEVGEIVARGTRMMRGYWQQEAATREAIRSGWIYTGDLGYQDEDSYIYLSGRAKDFIKRGGEMVSPEEVEQVLMAHPQVEDAAVIGVPDVEWGEEVRAVVVRREDSVGEEDLIQYCQQKLASYKRPRSVVFVDELPRNVMGKVLKRDLREQYG
ncbi:MAG: long-chain-fatty-acid--CoA ligase [Chloroflexi bacterium]|nr:long-chain-fatty-acid--CoA ligase [Chloroflexota bacterium]MCI0794759.1 long-chain-fatty-acid--CoA ligase [Chloroflexota bacterium]MCI0800008.1 long-chain-fatty-acid--CoA ligase [Chloroflexota bacterium]